MLLYKYLEMACNQHGNKYAIQCDNSRITYDVLKKEVDLLFSYLREQGIESGVNVGVILHNSIDYVKILIALSRNNNKVFLLNPNVSQDELIEMKKKGKIQIFIIESYLEKLLIPLECPYIVRKNLINKKVTRTWGTLEQNSQEGFCFVQCSSGTTGVSKMAQRTIENLNEDSNNIISTLNYQSDDVIYCPVPMYHGYGLTMGLIASLHAASLLITDRWFIVKNSAEKLRNASIIIGVPEIFERMAESSDFIEADTFLHAKWIISSSNKLSKETALNFYKKYKRWINQMYGMMEVSTISVNLFPDVNNYWSVGRIINGLEFRVQNNVLYVKGKTVSEAYLVDGGEKNITGADGWFKTNDIVQFSNNLLFLVDRYKE